MRDRRETDDMRLQRLADLSIEIRMLKARKDRLILLVEHKMDVVRELSDRIVVLHNGQLVADGEPATVIASPVVQQAYLGMAAEEPA